MKPYPLFFIGLIVAALLFIGGRAFGQDSPPAPAPNPVEPLAVEALLGTALTYQGQLTLSGTGRAGVGDPKINA